MYTKKDFEAFAAFFERRLGDESTNEYKATMRLVVLEVGVTIPDVGEHDVLTFAEDLVLEALTEAGVQAYVKAVRKQDEEEEE